MAAGYLWLATLWVIFGYLIPTEDQATGLIAQFYALNEAIGVTVLIASVTFVAYIIGVVTSAIHPNWIMPTGAKLTKTSQERFDREADMITLLLEGLKVERKKVATLVGPKFAAGEPDDDWNDQDRQSVRAWLGNTLTEDVPSMAVQLQAANKDMWDAYERAESESNFRLMISLPLAVLIASVGCKLWSADRFVFWPGDFGLIMDGAILVALVVGFLLLRKSREQLRKSNDIVVLAGLDHLIRTPRFMSAQAIYPPICP
ncbi:hypothetical protein FB464_1484 [Subtercola boreus]|nr:hypothetical protein FB464_1484 [Subtercola boreus]